MLDQCAAAHEDRSRLNAAALEQVADFIVITDASDAGEGPKICYANASLLQATGYDAYQIIGKPSSTLVSPTNDPKVLQTIRQRQARAQANFQEFLMRRADGTDMWIEFVGRPFSIEGSRNYRILVGREITLRRRAANQIALFSAAVEVSRDRIIVYESDGSGSLIPTYENQRATEMRRYQLREWLSHESIGARLRSELLDHGEISRVFTDVAPNGTPRLVQLSAQILKSGDRIDGAVSIERTLSQSDRPALVSKTPLLSVATLVTLIGDATTTQERFTILRAILLDQFDAEVTSAGPSTETAVRIDTAAKTASFTFGGVRRSARWNNVLDEPSLTALRFAIAVALEHERVHTMEP